MKTNRNVFLLAFVAFVLSLILTSCSGGADHETTAEVRVVGTRASSNVASVQSTAARSSSDQFESAMIVVDGKDITNDLKPEKDPDYQADSPNDTLFGADVPVLGNTVSYSVEPRPGFVFDEWELDSKARRRIRIDHGQNWMNVMREIMMAIAGDPETIEINPDYIRYIRPTFDRGAYFDASHKTVHDENTHIGTKSNPISSINDLMSFIKKYSNGRFDDDELTIKFTASSNIDNSLDLSQLRNHGYWDDDELEIELKLIGGYDPDSWRVTGRTSINGLKLPSLSYRNDELEIEIEFRNIAFTELDYSELLGSSGDGDDREFEFRNCSVVTLSNARFVNGLIVKTSTGGKNTTFVNSVAQYDANDTYIHSIITGYLGGEIRGVNNIVVYSDSVDSVVEKQADDNNYYISYEVYEKSFGLNGYKTSYQSLIDELTTATALYEDAFDDDNHSYGGIEIDDDMIEEDIEGRERYLIDDDDRYGWNTKVSYGPYEYKWFDD